MYLCTGNKKIHNMDKQNIESISVLGILTYRRALDGYIDATAYLTAYIRHSGKTRRVADFLRLQHTRDLINKIGIENPVKAMRGRLGKTWFHEFLFARFVMWIFPEKRFEVMRYVADNFYADVELFKPLCCALVEMLVRKKLSVSKLSPMIFEEEKKTLYRLVTGKNIISSEVALTSEECVLLNDLLKIDIELMRYEVNNVKRYVQMSDYVECYKIAKSK